MTLKRCAAASAAVLLALSLSACGDDDGGDGSSTSGAPADASEDEFCEAFNGFTEVGAEEDPGAQVDAAKSAADDLEGVGTPDGIPDDARKGFETFVEAMQDIDEDDVEKLAGASEEEAADVLGFDGDDVDNFDAFFTYAGETCFPEPGGESTE